MDKFEQAYLIADEKLRIKRSIVGCILVAILMPVGIILDYIIYPTFLLNLTKTRLICSLLVSLVLLLHYRPNSVKYVKYLTFSWMILVQITMCYMIFITDKNLSTYYAGLNLVVLGVGVLLPLSASEIMGFCIVTILIYIFSATFDADAINYNILFNNLYFLTLTSIISTTASYFNTQNRFKEFQLNYNLKTTNQQLVTTQAQLIQSEKMNAIGNLSAGILHEINNPLNYTMTAVQIIKMDDKVNNDADLKDTVLDIEEGMSRIKNIVSDLHNFAYPEQADQKTQFSILSAVESAIRFTSSECSDMEVVKNINPELMVSAARTHIVQVLVNLITNACKAIVKSGKDGVITFNAEQKDDRVNISVSDNGIGMNEETLKKVFDPFFTTSEVGQGMGMGLSVSYTIIKNHGGILFATSKLGKGSVFSFDLST